MCHARVQGDQELGSNEKVQGDLRGFTVIKKVQCDLSVPGG